MKRFAYSIMGFIILMAIFIYLACTGAGTSTLIAYAIGRRTWAVSVERDRRSFR